MRELIYISRRKLDLFRPDRPQRSRWLRRINQVSAKAPFGELQVGLDGDSSEGGPSLHEVIKHIERSERPPRWYLDGGLCAGDWVHFEARLNFSILRGGISDRSVLLFWEPRKPRSITWPDRLLLHCSPEHLLINSGEVSSGDVEVPSSAPIGLVEFLANLHDQHFSQGLWYLLRDLDNLIPMEMASWMAGFARVTTDIKVKWNPFHGDEIASRVVVASPLYVEHISAPSHDI